MHAFIITQGTIDTRREFVLALNTLSTELIHVATDKTSISLKQIQELNGPLSISPRLPRIVWIEEANLLTIPAQNALLKMLEEPPERTDFYLTCATKSSLLPTILSRSKLIQLNNSIIVEDPAILKDLKSIMALSSGDRLTSIVKRDRTESIVWISKIESALKAVIHGKNLSNGSYKTLANIAKAALSAHTQLLANCSVGLVTQNFYLTLPHTHAPV